jgi:uridylate kinase
MKATMVDGVYDKDPKKFPDAVKFDTLTFEEVKDQNLSVIDMTATALCHENNMPLLVFDISDPKNIYRAIAGEKIVTIVTK